MQEALRPMTAGQLLDATFALYKRNLGLAALLALPSAILGLTMGMLMKSGGIEDGGDAGATVIRDMAILLVGGVLSAVVYAVSRAATVSAAAELYLGQTVDWRRALASVRGHIWRSTSIVITYGLGVACAFFALSMAAILCVSGVAASCISLEHTHSSIFAGVVIVTVIAVVLGFLYCMSFVVVRYLLALPISLFENKSSSASFKRASLLAKGSHNTLSNVYGACWLLNAVITVGVSGLAAAVPTLMHLPGTALWVKAMTYLSINVCSMFLTPLSAFALALLYFEQRIRKEGYDIERMLEAAEEAFEPAPPPLEGR